MSNDIEIGLLAKNRRESIRVALRRYNGRDFIDVRLYFKADDGALCPTAKGVSVAPDRLDELIALLGLARRAAIERGLLQEAAE